jgi:hypothetical protein
LVSNYHQVLDIIDDKPTLLEGMKNENIKDRAIFDITALPVCTWPSGATSSTIMIY